MVKTYFRLKHAISLFFIMSCMLMTACNYHLQGEMQLAAPLHRLYLQAADPYGYLVRNLAQYLKMSNVQLVSSPDQANLILAILQDSNSQVLLSVSGTQQTRQYNLITTVQFEVIDRAGQVIVSPQTLSESRPITTQSNQILGSSNEATLFYQQMRRSLAYAIMNRLASQEITQTILRAYPTSRATKNKS
jgi:LPS-assembly lipoprotein